MVLDILLPILLNRLPYLGLLLASVIDYLRGKAAGIAFAVAPTAAPEELKAAVIGHLNQLIDKIDRPLVRMVLSSVVNNVVGVVLDDLYDALFGRQMMAARLPIECRAATADLPGVSDAELAKMCECAAAA